MAKVSCLKCGKTDGLLASFVGGTSFYHCRKCGDHVCKNCVKTTGNILTGKKHHCPECGSPVKAVE